MAAVIMIIPVFSVTGNAVSAYNIDCPYIFIHGFMGSVIYTNPDDPDSPEAWPPSSDNIKSAVGEMLPLLGRLIINHNWEKFSDSLIPIVNDLLSPIYLDENGEVNNNSGVRWSYPSKDSISKSSKLKFVYDWRVSPLETAAQLNDFINYVLECSGSDKVNIECHSYGGVVANTYAKLYGTDKVKGWVFNSTAVYGEDYTGDLMTGQLVFDADALTEYMKGAFDYNENEEALNFLFSTLKTTGVTKVLCDLVNYMLLHIGEKAFSKTLLPMFGSFLSIWAMVPDEQIDEAYDYVFNKMYKDDPTDYSKLQAKINEYNTEIRQYKTDTLKQINNDCNMYVISRYGYSAMFMTPSWQNASDNIIDVKHSSFGATVSQYNKPLSDDYLKTADSKYISPDKHIDASTCLFPDQTWYIRHLTHARMPESISEFTLTLLYYNGQATVNTFNQYPQYLYYDEITEQIIPDELPDIKISFADRIINIFSK